MVSSSTVSRIDLQTPGTGFALDGLVGNSVQRVASQV